MKRIAAVVINFAFLFAISVHESAHAYVAWRCGDPTAYMLGRVSLNPIKHIDPFGTLILPIVPFGLDHGCDLDPAGNHLRAVFGDAVVGKLVPRRGAGRRWLRRAADVQRQG